jgi:phosphate-selective porin OprO/OprP
MISSARSYLLPLFLLFINNPSFSSADDSTSSNSALKAYYNKGTIFEAPDFSLKINVLMQTRYVFSDNDLKDNNSSFSVKRARIITEGKLPESFSYKFESDFVGTKAADGTKAPHIRDVWISWQPNEQNFFRFGQMKTFISRQEEGSSSKLQFIDTSKTSDFFSYSREQGAAWRWQCPKHILETDLGLFNGNSDKEGINSTGLDTNHLVVGTIRFTPLEALDAGEEADVNYTENLALSFGVTGGYSEAQAVKNTVEGDHNQGTLNIDANLKYHGLSIHGEYFVRHTSDALALDSTTSGAYVQSGYFLIPKKLEVAARWGTIDCDSGNGGGDCTSADTLDEASGTVNYYFIKHNLKLQGGVTSIHKDMLDNTNSTDTQYGVQATTNF